MCENCKRNDEASKRNLVMSEASVVSKLSHESICFLQGIIVKDGVPVGLVTSIYMVNGFVVTIHDVIPVDPEWTNIVPNSKMSLIASLRSTLNIEYWLMIFRQVLEGLIFIHTKGIIHRDIKTDNIVFYNHLSLTNVHPVIIDFGKAVFVAHTKKYKLSNEQKKYYCTHHGHIAPDLVDGINAPSPYSDMFSCGRLFKSVIASFPLPISQLPKAALSSIKMCLKYNPEERPTAKTFHENLHFITTKNCC